MYLEIDRCASVGELRTLEKALHEVLGEVRLAVADFAPMKAKAEQLLAWLGKARLKVDGAELAEVKTFLEYLLDNHFTFLGYEEFTVVEEKDGAAAEVHYVKIHDAKLHYHQRTDEFYYIIDGQGTMILDDETIELHKGVVVYVPRGVKHKAVGDLTVLTVCIPRGVLSDVHELE